MLETAAIRITDTPLDTTQPNRDIIPQLHASLSPTDVRNRPGEDEKLDFSIFFFNQDKRYFF